MNNGKTEGTFLWIIENYGYCWHKNAEGLLSPDFTFSGLENTSWCLLLYPKGFIAKDEGSMSLFLVQNVRDPNPDTIKNELSFLAADGSVVYSRNSLVRNERDLDTETVTIKYELSLLASDGSVLHSRNSEYILDMYSNYEEFRQFLQTDEIHLRRKEEYLHNGTLRVRCKMWTGEGDIQNAEHISARTRIITEQISFFHVVESFGTLQPNVKHTLKISSALYSIREVSSSLYYTGGTCGEDKIVIEIVPSDAQHILHKCKIFLVNEGRNLIECGGVDYGYDAERISVNKLPLSLTREFVMNKKNEYLVNEKIILWCECTFSLGLLFNILEANPEFPLAFIKQGSSKADSKDICKAAENVSGYTSVLEDIKGLYISQRLTDVKLKTKTKSFLAHKIVLCARSPVFEAMLTSDMKEKITATIQIDDLENNTVEQLLLFLYSDSL